jgi:hypothetical protein
MHRPSQQELLDLVSLQGLTQDDLQFWSLVVPFLSDLSCASLVALFEASPENTQLITRNLETKAILIARNEMPILDENLGADEESLFSRLT